MNKEIKILHLEDSPKDSEIIHSIIESGGIEEAYFLVEDEKDFIKILDTEKIDIILSDYSLPDYNGNEALKYARKKYPLIPFIFVSGTIGEDAAINAMVNGATDYVLKNKLERLVPAIKRALHEQEIENQRKQTQEALITSETNYRRLFESAKDGILILDADTGKITDVNPFLIELLGYSREQFIAKAIWEIGFFNDIIENQEKFLELQKKKYVRYDDLSLKTTDGREINVEFVSNVYLANHHHVIQCNIRDITERIRTEENMIRQKNKAEESDRLKTAFLNNISHELRTPLNGILGFGEMIIDPDLTMKEKEKYLNILNSSSDRLLNTVNDFMDISLIVSGNIEVRSSLFNPMNLLEAVQANCDARTITKNLDFKLIKSKKPISFLVSSDMELIKKILLHLIDNAVKFSEKGTIEFGCRDQPGLIEFFVRDQGIGISSDNQIRIFENFMQGDASNTRKYEGSGLGLSIAKGLVEILGGTIAVESVKGSGSEFRFTIPS